MTTITSSTPEGRDAVTVSPLAVTFVSTRYYAGGVMHSVSGSVTLRPEDARVLAASLTPEPAPSAAECWSCKRTYTQAARSEADGNCPHCGVEIAQVDRVTAEEARLYRELTCDAVKLGYGGMAEALAAVGRPVPLNVESFIRAAIDQGWIGENYAPEFTAAMRALMGAAK